MKPLKCIFAIVSFLFTSLSYSQTYKSNPSLDFKTFFSGVRIAHVVVSDESDNKAPQYAKTNGIMRSTLIRYLQDIGFDQVDSGKPSELKYKGFTTWCDVVTVYLTWKCDDIFCKEISIEFHSCNADVFQFKSFGVMRNNRVAIEKSFYTALTEEIGKTKNYQIDNRFELKREMSTWKEESLRNHFTEKGYNSTEGIYEKFAGIDKKSKLKIGIVSNEKGYDVIYLAGESNSQDWSEGEIKAKLNASTSSSLFNAEWKGNDKKINKEAQLIFENGFMNIIIGSEKDEYIKLFPTLSSILLYGPKSGTAFALAKDGIVVTNRHVIAEARKITIRGINEDFSKNYSAKVILEDKNNDLAVLKIEDADFTSLGEIPFTINRKASDVGSQVFVMGYPLRATMGEEMKLTNGIISSRSGYEGNITTYQLTAPSQPGNSGAPVFDENGTLIGIVNAKHLGAENVTYAIKTSYLLTLLDLMTDPPKIQTTTSLAGKSTSEKVKILKKYTYIVEAN
jgi:hypothetical protein